jgi:hypothetical protein
MNIVLIALAALGALIAFGLAAAWFTGLQQPSRRIHRHHSVIFAALRQDDPALRVIVPDALWQSSARFTLIGDGDAYWTDYLILPPAPPRWQS